MNLICRLDQIKVLFFVNFFEKDIFLWQSYQTCARVS